MFPATAFVRTVSSFTPVPRRMAVSCKPRPKPTVTVRRAFPRAEVTENSPIDSTLIPEDEAFDPESGSVVISPSYNLAGLFMFTGGLWFYLGDGWLVAGFPVLLLGLFLSVQSLRVRFVFGPKKLSVAQRKGDGLEIIRGWQYEQMTNWECWWKSLPILFYFKESESYNGRGSVHFFPIICNGQQLLEEFRKRTPHLDKRQYS